MSRDDGFANADVDVNLMSDSKVRKLRRSIADEGEYACTLVVYLTTLLASWREGRPLSVLEAEQDVRATDERIAYLLEARLIDADGYIIEQAWDRWYGEAWDRREQRRKSGRERTKRHRDRNALQGDGDALLPESDALPERVTRHNDDVTTPVRPSVRPPARPPVRTRAREDDIGTLQLLGEELTQQPYVLANVNGKLGDMVKAQLRSHGLERVSETWREVADDIEGFPTIRQVILGADDRLNPIPRRPSEAERQEADKQAFLRSVRKDTV